MTTPQRRGSESRNARGWYCWSDPPEEGILVVGASREDADETLAALRNQLLIAGPLALAVAGALGF